MYVLAEKNVKEYFCSMYIEQSAIVDNHVLLSFCIKLLLNATVAFPFFIDI